MIKTKTGIKAFLATVVLVLCNLLLPLLTQVNIASADAAPSYTWQDPKSFSLSYTSNSVPPQLYTFTFAGSVDAGSGDGTFTYKSSSCTIALSVDYNKDKKTYEVTGEKSDKGNCGSSVSLSNGGKGPISDPDGKSGPAAPTGASTPKDDKNVIDCDYSGNPITWFVCPVVDGMITFINKADSFITNSLEFDTDSKTSVFAGSNSDNYYGAWNSFRVLATAIIVIAGLVMVSSQAMGFEMLDAYTIRKTLPRLIVAIIGISLSWPLMKFMVGFFNTLGLDVRQLIFAPFSSIHDQLTGTTLTVGLTGLLLTGIFLGILGALSFGLTALLAIFVGFAIIVFRDLALILIIILAPIGIACYIMPNTQKFWKLWSDNFLGLLAMFPIIEAFIAIGHVFAAVSLGPEGANSNATGADTLGQLIGFAAYFAPYFLLPVAFRLATGAIGTIAGAMNDRGRGAFDRLKKYRGGQVAKNAHDMNVGTRFNNRALNAATSRATTRGLGVTRRGRAAYNQKMDLAAAEHAKSAGGMAVQHNDDALRALTYDGEDAARRGLRQDFGMTDSTAINNAIAAAKASGGFGRARQVYAAQQLSNTGTGYDNIEQVAKTIARVSHGNTSQAASLAGNINSSTKQANRYDLAPGFGNLNALAQGELAGGAQAPQQHQYQDATVAAAQGVDAVSLLRGKPAQVQNLAEGLRRRYVASGGTDQAVEGQIADLLGSLQYGSTTNQGHVTRLLGNLGVPPRVQGQQQQPGAPGAPPPPPTPPQGSDVRLKQAIKQVGYAKDGIKLYQFKYIWSNQVYIGVMAQEILKSHPEAVYVNIDGFFAVDYAILGLQMMTLEEWQQSQTNHSVLT